MPRYIVAEHFDPETAGAAPDPGEEGEDMHFWDDGSLRSIVHEVEAETAFAALEQVEQRSTAADPAPERYEVVLLEDD